MCAHLCPSQNMNYSFDKKPSDSFWGRSGSWTPSVHTAAKQSHCALQSLQCMTKPFQVRQENVLACNEHIRVKLSAVPACKWAVSGIRYQFGVGGATLSSSLSPTEATPPSLGYFQACTAASINASQLSIKRIRGGNFYGHFHL